MNTATKPTTDEDLTIRILAVRLPSGIAIISVQPSDWKGDRGATVVLSDRLSGRKLSVRIPAGASDQLLRDLVQTAADDCAAGPVPPPRQPTGPTKPATSSKVKRSAPAPAGGHRKRGPR